MIIFSREMLLRLVIVMHFSNRAKLTDALVDFTTFHVPEAIYFVGLSIPADDC